MKKFGLILGLVSSVLLCTSCVNINNDKLTVAETSRWNGVVLLKYSFDEGGKPFVDDGTYVKWNTQGLSKALYECNQMYFGGAVLKDEQSDITGEMKDGKLIKGDVFRRFQCVLFAPPG